MGVPARPPDKILFRSRSPSWAGHACPAAGAKARPGSALPARLLAALFSCAAMILLFLLTPAGWGAASRLCAPAAFAALSVEPIGDLFSANTEVFLCAFLSFAALASLRALSEEREGPAMLWRSRSEWSRAGISTTRKSRWPSRSRSAKSTPIAE